MRLWKLSHRGSRQQSYGESYGGEAAQHQGHASQNNPLLNYDPSNLENVLSRFPQRHSCQYCQNDIINALSSASEHEVPAIFLRNGPEAVEAAKNGCTFYKWLLYFFHRSQSPTHHGFYLQCTPLRLKDPLDISSVQFLIGTAKYKWPCATFEVFTEAENPAASYTRPFNANVSSPEAFDVVKGWLKECCTNHTECQPHIPSFFPTRLLDVGESNGKLVKLVSDFKNVHTSEEAYATLSYCWGDDQVVKTTNATLAQHQVSIRTSDLAQTLQDAVRVAQSLGLRFLWVDSLCIIQDDPRDITREINRMSAYYENGHLSICASVAAGSHEGFLEERKFKPYRYGPFELPYRGSNGRLGSLKLAQYHDYSKAMDPVTSRAWIMQESLLAPRMLSYSYQGVAWSCRRTNYSDGGPSREWYNFEDRKLWARLQKEKDLEICMRRWNRLVESYTSRSLSDPNDRLPAMSGLVWKYMGVLSDTSHCTSIRVWSHSLCGMERMSYAQAMLLGCGTSSLVPKQHRQCSDSSYFGVLPITKLVPQLSIMSIIVDQQTVSSVHQRWRKYVVPQPLRLEQ